MSILDKDPGEKLQVLDDDGHVINEEFEPEIRDEELVGMYEEMKLARRLDERSINLQRQGRIGTYPPLKGQEGGQIGSVYAIDPEVDWVVPSYREHAVNIHMGVDPTDVLLYWKGDERGTEYGEDVKAFTLSVPIATQVPHATGIAWGMKLRDEEGVVMTYFGDGATSEGDFHEGMNFAGVFDVPAVFFCNNNQYAISVPRERQTASQTIAQKAQAYGFEGVVVDGMDPLAVYAVTREAVEKARDPDPGEMRPTLIEAVEYRYGAHTTADDPTKYRSEEEVQKWRDKDPLPRFEKYLRRKGKLDDERISTIENQVEETVEHAVEKLEEIEAMEPESMFDHVYEERTPELERQRKYISYTADTHGGGV
ncbi:MAG: pyruvate dehydrogenase (acetyl-transferring) E1 component subunit alpha [Halobacteria archaeon]